MTEQEKRIEDLKEFFKMIAPHIIGHRSASALFWVSVDGLSKELASLRSELSEKEKEKAKLIEALKMVLEADLKQSGSEHSIFTFEQQLQIQKAITSPQ